MLAVSPLRSPTGDHERVGDHGGFLGGADDDFTVDDNLLDYIDFSCDVPFTSFVDGDILPDLEVYPAELLAEFSSEDASTVNSAELVSAVDDCDRGGAGVKEKTSVGQEDEKEEGKDVKCGDEVVSAVTTEDSVAVGSDTRSSASAEGHSKRTSSSASAAAAKNSQGKRKVKVDWTPELHRRFVQAVEQLGIDKAVPSRILELMGIDCLTRHNIASHLQKYRSHRKHLLAREAEVASWTQKRQMYAASGQDARKSMNPWLAPTIGFPHPPPPPPPPMFQPFRPLHVWGHPTAVEPSMVHIWPRHLAPQPLPPWPHQPPMPPSPADPSFWHQHYNAARKWWGPHAVTQGTPCIPQPIPTMNVPAPLVPGVLPHPMYGPIPPPPSKQAGLQLQLDAHLSKESIDAAIGDVLVKPWLPLPLGLKPPSLDSVMVELQKQGISKVPPTSSG